MKVELKSEEHKTQVCKCCGRELPIEEFRVSRLGRDKTCIECTKKNQSIGHAKKREAEQAMADAKNARSLRLKDFTPRELMAELKRRGFKYTMEYTETHIINSKDIEV